MAPAANKNKTLKYPRVLLKLSGEALMGGGEFGIDPVTVAYVAREVASAVKAGAEVALVVGGGNIFRGVQAATHGMERVSADYMGMLATTINALALQNALETAGMATRVQSAIEMNEVCEPYIRRRALRHLEKGRVVIFAAGTGNPYFTTDTAAALRAVEIGASVIMKATKVDGVYTADPVTNPKATMIKRVSYMDVLKRGLHVMDYTAISLCMDNSLPIMVFNLTGKGNVAKAVKGQAVGTFIGDI